MSHTANTTKTESGTSWTEQKLDVDKLYYRDLQRQFVVDLLKKDGDFLLRRGSDGGIVLSVHHSGEILHFKFGENQKEYKLEGKTFPSLRDLLTHYHSPGQVSTRATGAKLLNSIQVEFDLIDPKRVKLDKQLGAGNFGQVWRARLLPDKRSGKEEMVAVKILTGDSTEKDRKECLAEARIMHMLDHENVVSVKGVCFGTSTGKPQLQLILEYCNADSLDKLLEEDKLTDEGKVQALVDAAKGMQYLHDRDIIHRDVASRNCLAHKGPRRTIVKIADFGLSRMAPEHYELATKIARVLDATGVAGLPRMEQVQRRVELRNPDLRDVQQRAQHVRAILQRTQHGNPASHQIPERGQDEWTRRKERRPNWPKSPLCA